MTPLPPRPSGEEGSGLVSAVFGGLMALLLLLLACHVCVYLYASSVLTAHAFDAARVVAGARAVEDRETAAEEARGRLLERLGPFGAAVEAEFEAVTPEVVLHVRADAPDLLPAPLAAGVGLDEIDRTVRVRAEDFQQPVAP